MPTPSSLSTNGLVKKTLAEKLLAEITNGTLPPGTRIIEGKWSQHFGVAQGTIREAINLLERDGFVTKEGGRSARVINLLTPAIHRGWDAPGRQGKERSKHA
jgi:DNA-binding GntR family transcriptional regulator